MDKIIIAGLILLIIIIIVAVHWNYWFWCGKGTRAYSNVNGVEPFNNPNVVPGPVVSFYKNITPNVVGRPGTFPNKPMIVGFHYTEWCGFCKQMKPVWGQVKSALSGQAIKFVENDEDKSKTNGIDGYPTIIKYVDGVASKYNGGADYEKLKQWIMQA